MSKTSDKYWQYPKENDEAHGIFLSMHDKSGIEYLLRNFPNSGTEAGARALSTTALWSGSQGNNVPVTLFYEKTLGIVIDSNKIEVPYADFYAQLTRSTIPQEKNINEKLENNIIKRMVESDFNIKTNDLKVDFYPPIDKPSKYEGKKVRILNIRKESNNHITIEQYKNAAKYLRTGPKSEDGNPGEIEYSNSGRVDFFLKNVWRRYFSPKPKTETETKKLTSELKEFIRYEGQGAMNYNEALVVQKGNENPIDGIVLDISKQDITKETINKTIDLLTQSRNQRPLKLYLYNRNKKEHIVRYLDNTQGTSTLQKLLIKPDITTQELENIFSSATPFRGFNHTSLEVANKRIDSNILRQNIKKIIIDLFKPAHIKEQLDFLYFSWGGEVTQNNKFYSEFDVLKKKHCTSKNYEEWTREKQLFNDIVREEMILVLKNNETQEIKNFLNLYHEKFDDLNLQRFLTETEYERAKKVMLEIINTIRKNYNQQRSQITFKDYGILEPLPPQNPNLTATTPLAPQPKILIPSPPPTLPNFTHSTQSNKNEDIFLRAVQNMLQPFIGKMPPNAEIIYLQENSESPLIAINIKEKNITIDDDLGSDDDTEEKVIEYDNNNPNNANSSLDYIKQLSNRANEFQLILFQDNQNNQLASYKDISRNQNNHQSNKIDSRFLDPILQKTLLNGNPTLYYDLVQPTTTQSITPSLSKPNPHFTNNTHNNISQAEIAPLTSPKTNLPSPNPPRISPSASPLLSNENITGNNYDRIKDIISNPNTNIETKKTQINNSILENCQGNDFYNPNHYCGLGIKAEITQISENNLNIVNFKISEVFQEGMAQSIGLKVGDTISFNYNKQLDEEQIKELITKIRNITSNVNTNYFNFKDNRCTSSITYDNNDEIVSLKCLLNNKNITTNFIANKEVCTLENFKKSLQPQASKLQSSSPGLTHQ